MILPKFALTRTLFKKKVKLQLQSQKAVASREFKGPIDCAKQIIRVQGFAGLWSGFTGSLAFRSNFFWMFLSYEVCERDFLIGNLPTLHNRYSCGISPFWQGRHMRYGKFKIFTLSHSLTAQIDKQWYCYLSFRWPRFLCLLGNGNPFR